MKIKVGEITKRTGISIRTLHYYEEVGLLKSPRRGSSGHRLYNHDDLIELQKILSLKQLGLSIKDIISIKSELSLDILDVLEAHQQEIKQKITDLKCLFKKIDLIVEELKKNSNRPDVNSLLDTISLINIYDKHFDEKQSEYLIGIHRQIQLKHWKTFCLEIKEAITSNFSPNNKKSIEIVNSWLKNFKMTKKNAIAFVETLEKEPEMAHSHGVDKNMIMFVKTILKQISTRTKN